MKRWIVVFTLIVCNAFGQGSKADYERALSFGKRTKDTVFRAKVEPHWMPGGDTFWYRNDLAEGKREFVFVDAAKGERRVIPEPPAEAPLESLPAGQTPHASAGGAEETRIVFVNRTETEAKLFWINPAGEKQAYGSVKPNERRAQQTYAGHVWLAADATGAVLGIWSAKAEGGEAVIETHPKFTEPDANGKGAKPDPKQSAWRPFVREFNLWVERRGTGEEIRLSNDGTKDNAYGEPMLVSPDGTKLVAIQAEPAQERKVYLVESSPKDQLQPKLLSYDYLKPGDRIEHDRPRLFDLETKELIPVKDDLFPNPWSISELRWSPDSARFTFLYNQRGHQLLRLISVDAVTGAARTLVDEQSKTFIDYSQKTFSHWLDASRELVWMSERDGWNHLWLYDTDTGRVKNQITRGEWVVRGVERVDEKQRQIWFHCAGIRAGQDPYYVHLARINFDGTGLVILTEGDGAHALRQGDGDSPNWRFSPDGRWFLDTYSRVDLPPVTELRRASDGKLVCAVEEADASRLLATGWRSPERFAAKGRDGSTDIYGIIIRPTNFDPAKKYPVIEDIYAGPHGYFVPKEWGRGIRQRTLAELGFIVVQIDGMGTNWRSRAFHDVAWKNLKDAGFPDRIAWMRAAAAQHPEMDLTRVGIFGGSAGGQSALGALLHHGDYYKAAVADCGCHDNRMDKIWWNEAWMGWPVGPEYADNSNVTHASKLTGKLLLTVGELDHNVDPSSTMQVVNALMKADKDFEMLIVPGSDHGAGERPYMARRRMDFFVRNLLGVEPRSR
jgi:dipeptidyl-peptidase-4